MTMTHALGVGVRVWEGGGGGRVQAYRYNTFIKNAVVTFISSDLTEQGGTACMVACDFGSNRHVNDATLVQSDN